jgi:clan AA aspartic protease
MLLPANKDRHTVVRLEVNSPTGGSKMGLVYAELQLISGDDLALYRRGFLPEDKIKSIQVNALVDSGAYMLVINEHIKQQLDLPVLEERLAKVADESEHRVEVVGPIEIRFENRRTVSNAIVLPGAAEVLLGSIPMEDLDVLIDPKRQTLTVNPDNPNIPLTLVK